MSVNMLDPEPAAVLAAFFTAGRCTSTALPRGLARSQTARCCKSRSLASSSHQSEQQQQPGAADNHGVTHSSDQRLLLKPAFFFIRTWRHIVRTARMAVNQPWRYTWQRRRVLAPEHYALRIERSAWLCSGQAAFSQAAPSLRDLSVAVRRGHHQRLLIIFVISSPPPAAPATSAQVGMLLRENPLLLAGAAAGVALTYGDPLVISG